MRGEEQAIAAVAAFWRQEVKCGVQQVVGISKSSAY